MQFSFGDKKEETRISSAVLLLFSARFDFAGGPCYRSVVAAKVPGNMLDETVSTWLENREAKIMAKNIFMQFNCELQDGGDIQNWQRILSATNHLASARRRTYKGATALVW